MTTGRGKLTTLHRRNCVLVVDGESAICGLVTSVLEDLECSVVCASNADEARKIANRGDLQCALVEIMLPDGRGEDVAEELARDGVPTILMSGHPEGVQRGKASRFAFLQKPFGVRDLLRMVVDQTVARLTKET